MKINRNLYRVNLYFKQLSIVVKKTKVLSTLVGFFLLFSFIVIFEKFIFDIFTDSLIGQLFFSYNKPLIVTDVITIILSVSLIFQSILKGRIRYVFSSRFYLLYISLLLYYLSFLLFPEIRIEELQFDFIKSKYFGFRYFDILFVVWTLYIVGYLIFRSKKQSEKDDSRVQNDNPIETLSGDQYRFNELAIKIVKESLTFKSTPRAFNIGINGEWGVGKTSLINLVVNRFNLKQKRNLSDHILIKYSPLLINKSSNLTSDFLLKFKSELNRYSIESNSYFRQYIYSLTNKAEGFWGFIQQLFNGGKSYEINYEEIKQILNRVDRRVIAVIDDLDRLSKDEIIEVLRLIRNICDFPNMVFIVAYDKSYLCEKLNDDIEKKAEKYLEKFFTWDINMPLRSQRLINEQIIYELKNTLVDQESQIDISFNVIPASQTSGRDELLVPNNLLSLCITTKRDLVRFINSLLIFDNTYFRNINFTQFLILELLKLKYSGVYNLLKSKKILKTPPILHRSPLKLELRDDYKELIVVENNKELEIIVESMEVLFSSDEEKLLSNSNWFDLYFSYDTKDFKIMIETTA